MVRPGSSRSHRLDLLLHRREGALTLAATGLDGILTASDTLDVSGLFIHSTHVIEREPNTTPGPRAFAMYVVRTGPSPGTPAAWLIDPHGVTEVEAADNHPPGPVDERVGCYSVERGEWSDGRDRSRPPFWFPSRLRLHWQYHWAYGRGPYLVATHARGHVAETIHIYRWEAPAPDSLALMFGARWAYTAFRGAADGRDYAGELIVRGHADLHPAPRAPARLLRAECPRTTHPAMDSPPSARLW